MVAFQGGHPPFKGHSPYLRPQPSLAESSPTCSKVLPLRCEGWVPRVMQAGPEQKKPNRRARCMQLPSGYVHFLHFCPDQRVKGRTTMQSACNRAKWAHPFDSNAPGMEAQAHTSCNQRASCYVRAAAPPLAPLPRLLDCGTSTVTRGNPAYDPTVPARRIDHGPVSRGRRRDSRCGQKWAGSNGGGRRAEATVTSSAKLTSPRGTAREPSLTA
jgi:hypothetical protein